MTRYTDGRRRSSGGGLSRKLVLLDLLLLCIIGGVIYPFIIERNRTGTIDGVNFELALRYDRDTVFCSVVMTGGDGALISESEPVTLSLQVGEAEPVLLDELPPPAGESRTVRYSMARPGKGVRFRCVIQWKGETLTLNAKTVPPEG